MQIICPYKFILLKSHFIFQMLLASYWFWQHIYMMETELLEWHEHLCRLQTDSGVTVKCKAHREPATTTASDPRVYPGDG